MAKTPEKPDYVVNFDRPRGTEIKYINGGWYLYKAGSVYDKELKRSRKISGELLGTITPNGLVPSRSQAIKNPPMPADVVEAGATYYFYNRTSDMRERLRKYFSDMWQEIYAVALIKTIYDNRFKRICAHYEDSILSYVFPGLNLQRASLTAMLKKLGHMREAIREYMKEDVAKYDRVILFDGHRIITASKSMDFAEVGYDSKRRYLPQTNLIYMFSLGEETGKPVYYKQFSGDTLDIKAFADILKESDGCGEGCTVLGDKGFGCEEDFDLLKESNLHYVISLKRGNRFVKDGVPDSYKDYDNVFLYHERTIQSKAFDYSGDGFMVYLYLDNDLLSDEMTDLTRRAEKENRSRERQITAEVKRRSNGKGKLTDAELAELTPIPVTQVIKDNREMGTISIRTNRLDLNGEQVYRMYKQREKIEQFFKTYGDTLGNEASYMRDIYSQEGWLFLNHLSSIMCIDATEEIATLGRSNEISFEDLRSYLIKIKAVRLGENKWSVLPMKKTVANLCEDLGIKINNLAALGL